MRRAFFLTLALLFCAVTTTPARSATDARALTQWTDLPPLHERALFPPSLNNLAVLLVWNGKHNGDLLLHTFAEALRRSVPSVHIMDDGRDKDSCIMASAIPHSKEAAQKAVELMAARKPGLVVFATGDCRVCVAWMAVEACYLELRGIATASLVTTPFVKTFYNVCQNMRLPPLICLETAHPVGIIEAAKVRAKARTLAGEFLGLFEQAAP